MNEISNSMSFPDVTQIVNTVIDAFLENQEKGQAAQKLLKQFKDAAVTHIGEQARLKLNDLINKAENPAVKELSEKDYADRLVNSSKGIAVKTLAYYHNEISLQELIKSLSETGIYDVAKDAWSALGMPLMPSVSDMNAIWQLSADAAGYSSLMALYQELMQALEDEHLAHERRIRIENECAETVASITKYRADMEKVTNNYLKEHYDTFEKGFAAMDKAIVDHDVNGYIKGNADIQKVLGYDVQFTTQDEFDNIMMSEEAFRF